MASRRIRSIGPGVLRTWKVFVQRSGLTSIVTQRYLLPQLTASFRARKSLQGHQLNLVERLHASARSLKTTQEEAFTVLPTAKPPGLRKDAAFSGCLTLEELDAKMESEEIDVDTVPHFTVLRCALASGKLEKQPTTEELFKSVGDHLPRVSLANNVELQVCIYFCSYDFNWSSSCRAVVGSTMGNVE